MGLTVDKSTPGTMSGRALLLSLSGWATDDRRAFIVVVIAARLPRF
jgi:hypothetical protein